MMSRSVIIKKDFIEAQKAWVISVEGELNAETISSFEDEVKEAFFEKPATILLDFKEVSVFVSSAVGTLLLLNDFVSQKQHKIKITKINQKVKEVLTLIGIYQLFVE